ncbi:phage holin family protein [Candidatus Gottesmanbacteria bacterium]|nr:phage holin family protein [Candidatus Gottesmanbacteria bacterium]
MIGLLWRWFLNALLLFVVAKILPGFELKDFSSALLAVVVIGLVNTLVKPILVVLTIPINLVTLGLFTFVVNALMLLLASSITPGFKIHGLGSALVGSIFLSLVSSLLHELVT